jgi:hypothetical protein
MSYSGYCPIHRFRHLEILSEGLVDLARWSARRAQKYWEKRPPLRRWQALRPRADTPLWNALALAVEAQVRRRGAKARLARMLGISRQRLHLLLVAKTAYPDAERTLLLLVWLQARLQGVERTRRGRVSDGKMSSIK